MPESKPGARKPNPDPVVQPGQAGEPVDPDMLAAFAADLGSDAAPTTDAATAQSPRSERAPRKRKREQPKREAKVNRGAARVYDKKLRPGLVDVLGDALEGDEREYEERTLPAQVALLREEYFTEGRQGVETHEAARGVAKVLLGQFVDRGYAAVAAAREQLAAMAAEPGKQWLTGSDTFVSVKKERGRVKSARTIEDMIRLAEGTLRNTQLDAYNGVAEWVRARSSRLEDVMDDRSRIEKMGTWNKADKRFPTVDVTSAVAKVLTPEGNPVPELQSEIDQMIEDLKVMRESVTDERVSAYDRNGPSREQKHRERVLRKVAVAERAVIGSVELKVTNAAGGTERLNLDTERDIDAARRRIPNFDTFLEEAHKAVGIGRSVEPLADMDIFQIKDMLMEWADMPSVGEPPKYKNGRTIEFTHEREVELVKGSKAIEAVEAAEGVEAVAAVAGTEGIVLRRQPAGYVRKLDRLDRMRAHRKIEEDGVNVELNQIDRLLFKTQQELYQIVPNQVVVAMNARGGASLSDIENTLLGLLDRAEEAEPLGPEFEMTDDEKKIKPYSKKMAVFAQRRAGLFKARMIRLATHFGYVKNKQPDAAALRSFAEQAIVDAPFIGNFREAVKFTRRMVGAEFVSAFREATVSVPAAQRAEMANELLSALEAKRRKMESRRGGNTDWRNALGKSGGRLRRRSEAVSAVAPEDRKDLNERLDNIFLSAIGAGTKEEINTEQVAVVIRNLQAGIKGVEIFNPNAKPPVGADEQQAGEQFAEANIDVAEVDAAAPEQALDLQGKVDTLTRYVESLLEYPDLSKIVLDVISNTTGGEAEKTVEALAQVGGYCERIEAVFRQSREAGAGAWQTQVGFYEYQDGEGDADGAWKLNEARVQEAVKNMLPPSTLRARDAFRFNEYGLYQAVASNKALVERLMRPGSYKTEFGDVFGLGLDANDVEALIASLLDSEKVVEPDFDLEATLARFADLAQITAKMQGGGKTMLASMRLTKTRGAQFKSYDYGAMRSALEDRMEA